MRNLVALVGCALLLIGFQNCSQSRFSGYGGMSSSKTGLANSGGQPYDGKPYVLKGPGCPDGTLVQSRIIYRSAQRADKVRSNCANLTPEITLSDAEFDLDVSNPDLLYHAGQTYTAETPSTSILPQSNFYVQLTGNLATNVNASVYAVDLNLSPTTIQSLRASNRTVMCNFSAGTLESFRPDAGSLPASAIGNNAPAGERWIDIRSAAVRNLMTARLDLARASGCHGVHPEYLDTYQFNTGFPISQADQLSYNRFLARAAHDRGLIITLADAPQLAGQLAGEFDSVISQQCYEFNECGAFSAFSNLGKAVLIMEYTAYSASLCSQARAANHSLIFIDPALDGRNYVSCQ